MLNYLPFKEEATQVIEHSFVLIYLYQTQSLLLLEWKHQISLEERKKGFLQALDLTHQYHIQNWIVNDEHLLLISPEEKHWILTDWMERTSQSPLLKLAVVAPQDYNHVIGNISFTQEGQRQYQKKGKIEHRVFVSFPPAFTWVLAPATD